MIGKHRLNVSQYLRDDAVPLSSVQKVHHRVSPSRGRVAGITPTHAGTQQTCVHMDSFPSFTIKRHHAWSVWKPLVYTEGKGEIFWVTADRLSETTEARRQGNCWFLQCWETRTILPEPCIQQWYPSVMRWGEDTAGQVNAKRTYSKEVLKEVLPIRKWSQGNLRTSGKKEEHIFNPGKTIHYFLPLMFFKIGMTVKSKNCNISWWGFQHLQSKYMWLLQHKGRQWEAYIVVRSCRFHLKW